MARPASHADEVVAPSNNLGPQAMADDTAASHAASPMDTPVARHSPTAQSSSFQSVNAPLIIDDRQDPSPAVASHQRASPSDLTAPPSEVVVPPAPTPNEPTSFPASHAPTPAPQGDDLDTSMTDTTYGTRSRNRTNARPNYAEDQEMDFEYSSAATTVNKKKSADVSASTGANLAESKRASEVTGFQAVNGTANGAGPGGKEAASSSTAATAAAPSKKRKAAGAPASTTENVASASATSTVGVRKPAALSAQSATARDTNIMTFTKHRSCLNKKGELVADDGTKLAVNDHVYLVCEPPGDPYYLCRIMEFLHSESDNPQSPVDSMRVNWYYRPRDVQRFSSDTRLVFGTMHSDMCPITSLRGKCTIKHRSEIDDLDAYRKERDSFYFVQAFDRFIRRSYECIPVREIINVPEKVKKALDERWKFVIVETSRVKELTSAAKTCKRCGKYAASQESVDCAICKNSYHMNCVQPPLPKKPSRGFAWACGPCSRASEKKMEARNTPALSANGAEAEAEAEDEELIEEEEVVEPSNDTTRAPSPSGEEMIIDDHPATQAEIALAKMWPMRYLGIHARVEDALQYDDRAIYPRASSRLGPRHQANVNVWHGRPVELVKPAEIKKRYNKGNAQKKEGKLTKETLAAMEADREERAKRPKWVQDEPTGYVPRGEDFDSKDPRCTAKPLFKMPEIEESSAEAPEYNQAVKRNEAFVDDYLKEAKQHSRKVGVPPFGVNYIDKALELLYSDKYNVNAAIDQLVKIDRVKDLHEPVLTKSELAKFEEGVAKYGSEHRLVRLHMKTNLPHADVVRFYYLWKKTPKGREIWGNYGGRKKRKLENDAGAKLQAEVAHDVDDSAFDTDKAARKHRGFQCKFCQTTYSRQWRRAPGVSAGQTVALDKQGPNKDKKDRALLALCLRCAGLWRKYAIQWEDVDEVSKKAVQGGSRTLKKRIDEELLRELLAANDAANTPPQDQTALPSTEGGEPPKKRSKMDKEAALAAEAQKKKLPPPPKEPTPPPPPIIPAQPSWRDLPCAVCKGADDTIACHLCKLTVHRQCFGLRENEGVRTDGDVKWTCEQCQNDRNPTVSTDYSCCLCLTEETQIDLVEPPRVSHKKKTDREREKERLEKELADGMRAEYRARQISLNRPPMPREPLKRTTGNNWVHVYCALWAPEIRFSDARALEVAEGFQQIPPSRFESTCKLCKNKDHQNRVRENAGACVNCFQCNATFHASCAFEAGYQFGFDVQPVKGSRKDSVTTATLGQETGLLTAIVLCKEHVVKTVVHPVNEVVDEAGTTAIQVFAQNYKQADLTLTGTVRKANLAQLTKDKGQQPIISGQSANRRESGAHSIAAAVKRGARTSSVADAKLEPEDGISADLSSIAETAEGSGERRCMKCGVDVTPRWHTFGPSKDSDYQMAGRDRTTGEQRSGVEGRRPIPHEAHEMTMSQGPEPPRQNIRFMAPGASGRAWDGMPERFGSRPIFNSESHASETPNGHPNQDTHPPPTANGDPRSRLDDILRHDGDEGYHNHALPRYQNPAMSTPPPGSLAFKDEAARDYMCHKCFVKKKIDPTPTPPPEERRSPRERSTPHQFPRQPDWNRPSQPPLSIDQQFKMWDEPQAPPQSQHPAAPSLPAQSINGVGHTEGFPPSQGYGGPPPPPPGHGYPPPPFNQQPNGYHVPPPQPMHDGPPAPHYGPTGMHERHNSYGYPPQSSPRPPHYPPPPHPSAPMNGYGPPNQAMSNGVPSPRTGPPPPLHSPTYPGGPHPPQPPQQQVMQPMRSEGSFPLPSAIGGPSHSSPGAPFGRPRGEVLNGPPPPAPPPGEDGRPTTPHGGSANGVNGASASPNLIHLIH